MEATEEDKEMKNPVISVVAAIQKKDRGIGKDGHLLWRLPEDLKRFKTLTMGHPIVMGSKTFRSIGKPLPGRINIVVTRNPDFSAEGCEICGSLQEAIALGGRKDSEIFVIGGGEIYAQALPLADNLYLTEVESEVEADTFFPTLDYSKSRKLCGEGEHEGIKYRFLEMHNLRRGY